MANLKEQLVKVEREKRELVPYSAVEVRSIIGVVQIMVRHISFKLSTNSSSEFSPHPLQTVLTGLAFDHAIHVIMPRAEAYGSSFVCLSVIPSFTSVLRHTLQGEH